MWMPKNQTVSGGDLVGLRLRSGGQCAIGGRLPGHVRLDPAPTWCASAVLFFVVCHVPGWVQVLVFETKIAKRWSLFWDLFRGINGFLGTTCFFSNGPFWDQNIVWASPTGGNPQKTYIKHIFAWIETHILVLSTIHNYFFFFKPGPLNDLFTFKIQATSSQQTKPPGGALELDHLLRRHRWLLVGHRLRRGRGLHGHGERGDGWNGQAMRWKKRGDFS